MVDLIRRPQWLVTVSMLLVVCVSCSSCETLRKKFTRQKKKDQSESTDFNPVLEPQDYPAPEYNAAENYKEHYDLVKVWYKDLTDGVTQKEDNDGRVRYALKQIDGHLDGMASLLAKEKRPVVEDTKALLKGYKEALAIDRPLRNRAKLQSELHLFYHQLIHDLRFDAIKKDLVKLEPPH